MDKQHLIEKFCPILKFHPDEQFFPSSIEYILKNSLLGKNGKNLTNTYNTLTTENLVKYQEKYKLPMYLNIKKSSWKGEKENLHNVPIYATASQSSDYYCIQYVFIYPYNGPFKIFDKLKEGQHQFDVEHITVYVSKERMEVEQAYYSEHASGVWLHRSEIEFDGKHPVVYIANHSHAAYNKAGTYYRIFFLANDHTSNKGIHWHPKVVYIDKDTDWNKYQGFLGKPDNCQTPMYRTWWKHEDGTSTNWFKRLFLCQ